MFLAACGRLVPALAGAAESPDGSDAAAAHLRRLIIDGCAAGRNVRAFLDVYGRPMRARVMRADAEGVTASVAGVEMMVAWEEMSPARFGSMAARLARTGREHLLVARHFALHGLREEAKKACERARSLEGGLEEEIRAILALLPTEAPEKPGRRPARTGGSAMKIVTVEPKETEELLANPGMGWQTFHRFADEDPNLAGIPSSTCYFRWYWKVLEPKDGGIDFGLIDRTLSRARQAGQKLAFRAMTAGGGERGGSPLWLKDLGCKGYLDKGQWIPDHDDPLFLEKQLRLIAELGGRYDGHPDVAVVDIGSVGLWGEWHFSGTKVPMPRLENRRKIVDAYFDAFKKTPLVMLIGDRDMMEHATKKGAGWRADCLGDMGGFSKTWNHMEHLYKQRVEESHATDAWKHGPVAWESCWDMRKWAKEGWDVRHIFRYALDLHGSYVNNKSAPIPEGFRDEVEELLRRLGYRFVLRSLSHPRRVRRDAAASVRMEWENVGVAPCYADYALAFRVSPRAGGAPAVVRTKVTVRSWLPGKISLRVPLLVPEGTPAGEHALSVGIVGADDRPVVRLAIQGGDADGWHLLSTVAVE